MAWIDLSLLVILLLSLVLGLWRGLLYELLSLAGWLMAYLGARFVAPYLETWLPADKLGPTLLHALALVLSFMLILLVWGLSAKLVRALLHASPLSVLDRLGGVVFGALRGVLLGLLLVLVLGMTPVAESQAWSESTLVPDLQWVLKGLRPWMPAEVVKFIPA